MLVSLKYGAYDDSPLCVVRIPSFMILRLEMSDQRNGMGESECFGYGGGR
jgi:hypothetical protein